MIFSETIQHLKYPSTKMSFFKFQVKQALLNYIQGLVSVMDPLCFTNNSDTRLAISRIITWTSEPKSPEVRKVGYSVC